MRYFLDEKRAIAALGLFCDKSIIPIDSIDIIHFDKSETNSYLLKNTHTSLP